MVFKIEIPDESFLIFKKLAWRELQNGHFKLIVTNINDLSTDDFNILIRAGLIYRMGHTTYYATEIGIRAYNLLNITRL